MLTRAFRGSGDSSKGHLELQAPLESSPVWQENRAVWLPHQEAGHLPGVGMKEAPQTLWTNGFRTTAPNV